MNDIQSFRVEVKRIHRPAIEHEARDRGVEFNVVGASMDGQCVRLAFRVAPLGGVSSLQEFLAWYLQADLDSLI
jgi:hypothetical protein